LNSGCLMGMIYFSKILSVGLLWALGMNLGQAVLLREEVLGNEALMEEVRAKALEVDSVVGVVIMKKSFSFIRKDDPMGSGVIVGPRWVLTNAHVCAGLERDEDRSIADVRVRLEGRSGAVDAVFVKVKAVRPHPEYINEPRVQNDLCLLELEETIDLQENSIAEFLRANIEALEPGMPFYGAGYGYIGIAGTGQNKYQEHEFRRKLYYENRILKIDDGREYAGYWIKSGEENSEVGHGPNFALGEDSSVLQGNGARGDSGSGQFTQYGKLLIGLLTMSGQGAVFVGGGENLEWIDLVMAQVEENGYSQFDDVALLLSPMSKDLVNAVFLRDQEIRELEQKDEDRMLELEAEATERRFIEEEKAHLEALKQERDNLWSLLSSLLLEFYLGA